MPAFRPDKIISSRELVLDKRKRSRVVRTKSGKTSYSDLGILAVCPWVEIHRVVGSVGQRNSRGGGPRVAEPRRVNQGGRNDVPLLDRRELVHIDGLFIPIRERSSSVRKWLQKVSAVGDITNKQRVLLRKSIVEAPQTVVLMGNLIGDDRDTDDPSSSVHQCCRGEQTQGVVDGRCNRWV